MSSLVEFLKSKRDQIVKTVRYNVKREKVGYGEYTCWETTISFDEMETVDFDELLKCMEEFERSFKEKK